MLGKVCIFCGEAPSAKNKEHVIPQWLLRATGNPGRKVFLGRDWNHPELKSREYSWSSFTFPACTACNTEFSKLETAAKSIVESLLASRPLSADDFDVLLDWLDKVRIGLWIGLLYLNKNYRGVEPQFYIKSRIASRDRLLVIYRDDDDVKGVTIVGAESPIFQVMPSCLALSINNLHIFNASSQDLLSSFLGFPTLTNQKLSKDREGFSADIVAGSEAIRPSLLPYAMPLGGTAIFQGIIPPELRGSSVFDTAFVKNNCLDYVAGRGKVFIQQTGPAELYPDSASFQWLPPEVCTRIDCYVNQVFLTDIYLTRLYSNVPAMGDLTQEQIEYVKASREGILKLHTVMTEHHMRQITDPGSEDDPGN